MDQLIAAYRKRLQLQNAHFMRIDHEDAIVATVFRITPLSGEQLILKVCSRPGDYLRELYFLKHFAGKIPVPRIMDHVPPERGVHGAVLMECLPGKLLKTADLTVQLSSEIGSLLACIHSERVAFYGDLTDPEHLNPDPRIHFTAKFQEGMEECKGHLPESLIAQCNGFFNKHLDLLIKADGPCIVHRDFRPGNLLVEQGKVRGIIDWSSGRGGFAEEDFCPLEFGEWSTNDLYRRAFLEGYAGVRKVPAYQSMMPLLRLSRAIGTIGFTVKRGTWDSKSAKIYQFNRKFLDSLPLTINGRE